MNVPPLDRIPFPVKNIGPVVLDWNMRLSKMARNLSNSYEDATVFEFDTHNLFDQVFANVSSYPTTSQLKNLTGYCPKYNWIDKNIYDPNCGAWLREYMWGNNLHPTYPMHQTIAAQIPISLGENRQAQGD